MTKANLFNRNLQTAIAIGGQPLTYAGITGNAMVTAIQDTIKTEDRGVFPQVSLSATLPTSVWPSKPTMASIFQTGGASYRILQISTLNSGHAWLIVGEHVSGG